MNPTIENYQAILSRIRQAETNYQRQPNSVLCLAVTKHVSVEKLIPLIALGHQHFGENTVQSALPKITALSAQNLVWHYIGHIQTNKCQEIAQNFSWVHSICRESEVIGLAKHRASHYPPLQVCLQIKLDNNPGRNGLLPEEALPLAQFVQKYDNLTLRGLMVIPAPDLKVSEQQAIFKTTHNLGLELSRQGFPIDTYSMGMTQDLEVAIQEGATMVRIGTGIFGPREAHI